MTGQAVPAQARAGCHGVALHCLESAADMGVLQARPAAARLSPA